MAGTANMAAAWFIHWPVRGLYGPVPRAFFIIPSFGCLNRQKHNAPNAKIISKKDNSDNTYFCKYTCFYTVRTYNNKKLTKILIIISVGSTIVLFPFFGGLAENRQGLKPAESQDHRRQNVDVD